MSLSPTYDYIKINPESYPENHSQDHDRQRGENLMLRMYQDDPHLQAFPRQILEI
jgi:hypothetical protein